MILADRPTSSTGVRSDHAPAISVIIPVLNAAYSLGLCLDALARTQGVNWECIVVDDGSADTSPDVALSHGARLLRTERPRSGPGHARNLGAQVARAPVLCFLDADVVAQPDTLAQFVELFDNQPHLTAAFGSYDAQPGSRDLLSQYRNLFHHFVHQMSEEAASTFWSGCGAIRREDFLAFDGFDPRYTRPSIEDIELGYRLTAAGKQIRLAKHIQVTHLKRWTLRGMLTTDIRDRAIPWTALIHRTGHLPNDLNLRSTGRLSALSMYALLCLLVLGLLHPLAWLAGLIPILVLVGCNRQLYQFFLRERGLALLACAVPLHWFYFVYSSLVFVGGTLFAVLSRQPSYTPLASAMAREAGATVESDLSPR